MAVTIPVCAGGGHDLLYGQASDDVLCGDERKDTLYGGNQNDCLDGGAEQGVLDGGDQRDTLNGGELDDMGDLLTGGAGSDAFVYALTVDNPAAPTQVTSDSGTDTITDFAVMDATGQAVPIALGGDKLVFKVVGASSCPYLATLSQALVIDAYELVNGVLGTKITFDADGNDVADLGEDFLFLAGVTNGDNLGMPINSLVDLQKRLNVAIEIVCDDSYDCACHGNCMWGITP